MENKSAFKWLKELSIQRECIGFPLPLLLEKDGIERNSEVFLGKYVSTYRDTIVVVKYNDLGSIIEIP